MKLVPTNTCFDDALAFIFESIKAGESHYELCHGICTAPNGMIFSHAWVNNLNENEVITRVIMDGEPTYISLDRSEFFLSQHIIRYTPYPIWKCLYLNMRYKSWGPWEREYLYLAKGVEDRSERLKRKDDIWEIINPTDLIKGLKRWGYKD